jgi:lysophospholipase L1-like esterase
MVGTNDLAGNSGANSFDQYQNNLRAMVDLAQANGIDVIIASILPADHFSWRPSVNPAQQIKRINHWLQELADEKGLIYIDYYSAMANGEGGMPQALAADGVHPTLEGYTIMRNTLERALTKTH